MTRNLHQVYVEYVRSLLANHPVDVALKAAVGGDFDQIGILQRELLIQHGLKEDSFVIDVGCGSGRLAKSLAEYGSGEYLGLDVVSELVEYARNLVKRPGWRFEITEGLQIPEKDGRADMVCFFSVLTHLLHEDSYVYLQEAKRVLKPKGKIVFSFLEFSIPSLWPVFESSISKRSDVSYPLTMFMSRDMIGVWASHLGLRLDSFEDGDKPHIPLPNPIVFESGYVMEQQGFLGQSVCVLTLE
jgi:2-polyprenyl-3-methyl-5-hydroxy-6-metoxy-1,4-benzoquinol methylase